MLMRNVFRFASSLAAKVNALIRKEESAHPGMQEVAAMVYVGDVYVLREQTKPTKNDGWEKTAINVTRLGICKVPGQTRGSPCRADSSGSLGKASIK